MTDANGELTLSSEEHPSETDVAVIRDNLLAFNIEHIGQQSRSRSVSLFLRNAAGEVIGGLLGGWRWGWLYVDCSGSIMSIAARELAAGF